MSLEIPDTPSSPESWYRSFSVVAGSRVG